MPFATRDGCRLYWKVEGAADRPQLVLLNSIGTDMDLWSSVIPHLLPAFRVLRIDTRGHGASDAPDGDYSLDMLASDVTAVMEDAGIAQAAVAGVSLGGMIAMELALAVPERVTHLCLICTSAEMDADAWDQRVTLVRAQGLAAIAEMAMGRFLSPAFAMSHPERVGAVRAGLLAMSATGYAGAGAAIRDMALIDRIAAIRCPALVVSGTHDISTPYADHGRRIAALIKDAQSVPLDTAHLAPFEAPAALAQAIRNFVLVDPVIGDAEDILFTEGLAHRRRILGDDWVDRSLAARTAFTEDFQALVTRVAWHEIWSRPGLDDRTRRLIVIAITASLGRWEEFALHVRAGLSRSGFTRDELKEVLMQASIYAGLPAANTAFSEAASIIEELEDIES